MKYDNMMNEFILKIKNMKETYERNEKETKEKNHKEVNQLIKKQNQALQNLRKTHSSLI